MPRTFDRLFHLGRRRPPRDERRGEQPAFDGGALGLDEAELGPPPVLLPAAIFRQVLYDPAEFTPVWLRPRPGAAPDLVRPARPTAAETVVADAAEVAEVAEVAPAVGPKPAKRARRPKADGADGADGADVAEVAPPVGPKRATRARRPKADGASSPIRTRSKRVPKPTMDADDR